MEFMGDVRSVKSGKVYRVVGVKPATKMTKWEYEVWGWLSEVMEKLEVWVDVWVGRYYARLRSFNGMDAIHVSFWDEKVGVGRNMVVIVIERDKVQWFRRGIRCVDAQEMERAKIQLEYLKLELEERLNALLERELFR